MIHEANKPFLVHCPCGREIGVSATDAGAEVSCSCGAVVHVPNLSELRRHTGEYAYATSIADKVRFMVNDGLLPPKNCMSCGSMQAEMLACDTVCELPSIRGKGGIAKLILSCLLFVGAILLGWLFVFFSRDENVKVHGHEKIVRTPMSLCQACQSAHNLKKPNDVKQLLQRVPEYAKLLEEYPEATVHVIEQSLELQTRF